MKKRRTFARDCNLAAVKKMIERGLSYPELACDLGKKRPARADKKKRIQPIAFGTRFAKLPTLHVKGVRDEWHCRLL
jgi:hypothetical protein